MSFNINKEKYPQNTPNIIINIPNTEIRDIVLKTPEYIKYSFYGNQKTPNITINKTQYITNNLYIWKGKIHNIPNIQYDAELIIETINGKQKTFLCLLLKHSYTVINPTFIDNLWNNTDEKPVLIDLEKNLTTNNEAIFYKDGINTIIIPIKPIFINTNIKSNIPNPKCFIIPNFSNDYIIVNFSTKTQNNIQTIQENVNSYIETFTPAELTEQGLYLDCEPTSQSTNTLPAITIPLDANGNVNLSNSLLYTSIMNSLILFIIIIFIFLSLPTFYKFSVIDVINRINVPDKSTRLSTVCYFIFTAILILVISLVADGLTNSNIYQAYSGLLFGLMLIVGSIRLYFLRNNKDYNFQQIYNYNPIDLFIWLNEVYYYMLDHSSSIGMIYVLCNIIVILPFSLSALLSTNFIPSGDNITHVLSVIFGFGFAYNIIIAPFLVLVYDTFKVKT
jgi:hypothetical protein